MRRFIQVRPFVILSTFGIFLATLIAFIGAAFWNWRYGLVTHDKVFIINTVVAVGGFVLVAWGVIVALVAYVSATGSPDLAVEISFRFSFANHPTFDVADQAEWIGSWRKVKLYRQVEGQVRVTNSSKYSARNPGVRITLEGLGGISNQDGWTVTGSANQIGITSLQWDGGADYIIHGQWSRILPSFNVRGMFAYQDDLALVVDVAADGYGPKRIRMPVRILDADEYAKYSSDRADYFADNRVMRENSFEKFEEWKKNRARQPQPSPLEPVKDGRVESGPSS
jgi:hypothetical protein